MAAPVMLRIGAINTDWTPNQRDEAVKTPESLAADIIERLAEQNPAVLTLSEVSAKKLSDAINEGDTSYRSTFKSFNSKYDNIVQTWDSRTYEFKAGGEVFVSDLGKYVGVPLRHVRLREEHLHISVHMPHKRGKGPAFELLQHYITETVAAGKYEQIFVHGDFNENPERLGCKLPNISFAFEEEVTTRAGRKIDNVGAWDGIDFQEQVVTNEAPYSHHPIYATAVIEDDGR